SAARHARKTPSHRSEATEETGVASAKFPIARRAVWTANRTVYRVAPTRVPRTRVRVAIPSDGRPGRLALLVPIARIRQPASRYGQQGAPAQTGAPRPSRFRSGARLHLRHPPASQP